MSVTQLFRYAAASAVIAEKSAPWARFDDAVRRADDFDRALSALIAAEPDAQLAAELAAGADAFGELRDDALLRSRMLVIENAAASGGWHELVARGTRMKATATSAAARRAAARAELLGARTTPSGGRRRMDRGHKEARRCFACHTCRLSAAEYCIWTPGGEKSEEPAAYKLWLGTTCARKAMLVHDAVFVHLALLQRCAPSDAHADVLRRAGGWQTARANFARYGDPLHGVEEVDDDDMAGVDDDDYDAAVERAARAAAATHEAMHGNAGDESAVVAWRIAAEDADRVFALVLANERAEIVRPNSSSSSSSSSVPPAAPRDVIDDAAECMVQLSAKIEAIARPPKSKMDADELAEECSARDTGMVRRRRGAAMAQNSDSDSAAEDEDEVDSEMEDFIKSDSDELSDSDYEERVDDYRAVGSDDDDDDLPAVRPSRMRPSLPAKSAFAAAAKAVAKADYGSSSSSSEDSDEDYAYPQKAGARRRLVQCGRLAKRRNTAPRVIVSDSEDDDDGYPFYGTTVAC